MIKILKCSVSELNKSGAKNKTKDQGQKKYNLYPDLWRIIDEPKQKKGAGKK